MENNTVFNITDNGVGGLNEEKPNLVTGVVETDDVTEDKEDRYVTCQECDREIDCYNDNINIVYKGGDSVNNPHEELVLCTMCFQDMKDELIQQDYKCDDWDIEEEEEEEELDKEEPVKLCVNMDCERYPPDWDSEEDTEETYQEDQWKKCCLCDGYFDDNGMGDILFVQEEPNNQEAGCSLCGKSDDVVQMKGCGQYLCGDGCDED